jgi:hypothetical protein
VAVRLQAGVTKTTSAKSGNNSLKVFFITLPFPFPHLVGFETTGYPSGNQEFRFSPLQILFETGGIAGTASWKAWTRNLRAERKRPLGMDTTFCCLLHSSFHLYVKRMTGMKVTALVDFQEKGRKGIESYRQRPLI